MGRRIWIWVAPLALLLGAAAPPAFGQAERSSGRLCVFDLDEEVFGARPPGVYPTQGTFNTTKLCTGGARPVVILRCDKEEIENWPNRNLSRRNFPCRIDVSACGLEGGLVDATSSSVTINRNGSARLQCEYRSVGAGRP